MDRCVCQLILDFFVLLGGNWRVSVTGNELNQSVDFPLFSTVKKWFFSLMSWTLEEGCRMDRSKQKQ